MNAVDLSKEELRARAVTNRASIVVDSARVRAGLARFVRARRERLSAGWIVLYDALPGEPDLWPLIDELDEFRFALTRTPVTGRDLTVHSANSELEVHRFGYRQPVPESPEVADHELALVLVPGLAFDRHGARLGFGAGYYDRFLARLDPTVLRVGVSDGFILERIPTEAHDVAMTHLAGEFGVAQLPLEARPR